MKARTHTHTHTTERPFSRSKDPRHLSETFVFFSSTARRATTATIEDMRRKSNPRGTSRLRGPSLYRYVYMYSATQSIYLRYCMWLDYSTQYTGTSGRRAVRWLVADLLEGLSISLSPSPPRSDSCSYCSYHTRSKLYRRSQTGSPGSGLSSGLSWEPVFEFHFAPRAPKGHTHGASLEYSRDQERRALRGLAAVRGPASRCICFEGPHSGWRPSD
jgi:hypothetical protein